ncbi:MAG: GNAT family N-acetyltransferase [Legionellales bacterium]|nr:GNAT family N-acetyltransferase [Legionellales bacterium]
MSRLNDSHPKQKFCCGVEVLNKYLQKQAGQENRKNIAVTYVLHDQEADQIMGYYTLSASTIQLQNLPESLSKKLPRYPLVPTTLIGRLAVDSNYQKRGIGEALLIDALRIAHKTSDEVASFAVIVDAMSESAKNFYQKYGFISLSSDSRKLYLPMKTIRKLF